MEAVIVLGVAVLTSLIKRFVLPRWGDTGIHIIAFLVSLAGVSIYSLTKVFPPFQVLVEQALNVLIVTVAVYEILLKKLPFFKG